MAYQILLGAAAFDAVAYARALGNDSTAPFLIPDSAYLAYQEDVREDISRFLGGDYVVGTPATNASPLVTVANQQRYVCSVANGFSVEPDRISDVTYQSTPLLTNTTDFAYLALLPFSPLRRFFLSPPYIFDNPSLLTIRSSYLDVLDQLSEGFYNVVRDPTTGLLAIDLYPVPVNAGQPVYVRYQSMIPYTTNAGNTIYATFPAQYATIFGKLLYCVVAEQNLNSIARSATTRAGILMESGDAANFMRTIDVMRAECYQRLGATLPVALQG